MNFALFGWPCSLLFVPFGLAARGTVLFAWSLLSFAAAHLFASSVGVDLFGPVHYSETALPLLVLTVAGLARLAERFRASAAAGGLAFPCHLALALVLVGVVVYVPYRLQSLAGIAAHIAQPIRDVELATRDAGPVVVFAPMPFAPPILPGDPRHWLFYPPLNDPDLENRILWVNHFTVADDRRFMQFHPGRKGFVFCWLTNGDSALAALNNLKPGDVPDAMVGGSGEGPDWTAIEKDARARAP